MKWTFNELGLMQVLTWPEFILLVCVLLLFAVAGWVVIKFFRIAFSMMREE